MKRGVVSGRRGSSYTVVMLAMPVMIASVAMGVDWGQVAVARMQAQAAADEGALAAASALTDRPKTSTAIAAAQAVGAKRAEQYASGMAVNGIIPQVESVTLGYYDGVWSTRVPSDQAPNAVEVVATARVPMSFARFFGMESVLVRSTARAGAAVIAKRAPDLVIVQDVTPSMSVADLTAAKDANGALVDCIETYATGDTRGSFVRFANSAEIVQSLVSYDDAPGALYDVASGRRSGVYTSSGVCLASGGCTNHASGMYMGVSVLNGATEPPEDVGQAIIFITDGAPYSGGYDCTSTIYDSSPSTPYKTWLKSRCAALTPSTSQTACENAGGKWNSSLTPKCRAADNGSESTAQMGVGVCSKTAYTTEARCEGNGGVWRQKTGTTPNPSTLTRLADETRLLAAGGTWRDIDVYAVYYSAGATSAYHNDNIAFMTKHLVHGKGADLGVLDAPSGSDLVAALQEVCLSYTAGTVGLIP